MKLIPLTRGKFTMVDDEDFAWLNRFLWHASEGQKTWYACMMVYSKTARGKREQSLLPMHRLLYFGAPQVDHINSNGLDNQKLNLRHATSQQNNRNRRKMLKGASSKYKGVSIDNERGLWLAQIRTGAPGHKRRIGRFKTQVAAARAYDNAARLHFGEFALLNFPCP